MSTPSYPQLASGTLSQYPVRKTRRTRTVVNLAADGSTVRLADPEAETIEWRLEYEGLSDSEADAVEEFFTAAEGSLQGFTFLDPMSNLLAWSDRLDAEAWQTDPLLVATGGVDDPGGGTRGWRLNNTGGGGQRIGQTLQAPGGYTYCFSIYVRIARAAVVRLWIGDEAAERVAPESWSRLVFTAAAPEGAESIRFAVEVPAGTELDVYGMQAEAQGGAGVYRGSTHGGVYPDAHFGEDVFRITRTGFNRNSCTVKVIHANHL